MRAPGSGTAGRSARAGLVLLQSPAFRNAYIIQCWGREGDLGVLIGLQHFSGPWFSEGSRDLSCLIIIIMGGAKLCLLDKWFLFFVFFLGHY